MKFLPHLAIILLSFSCVEDFSSFKEAPLMGYIPTFHANYYTEIQAHGWQSSISNS